MHCFVALCCFIQRFFWRDPEEIMQQEEELSWFWVYCRKTSAAGSEQRPVHPGYLLLTGDEILPQLYRALFHKPWNFRIPGSAEAIRDDHFRMSGFGELSIFPGSVAIGSPPFISVMKLGHLEGSHNPMFTGTKIKHRYFSHWNIRPGSMILQVALFLWWDGQIGISSNFFKGSKGGVFSNYCWWKKSQTTTWDV